jgi:hypothetical protein
MAFNSGFLPQCYAVALHARLLAICKLLRPTIQRLCRNSLGSALVFPDWSARHPTIYRNRTPGRDSTILFFLVVELVGRHCSISGFHRSCKLPGASCWRLWAGGLNQQAARPTNAAAVPAGYGSLEEKFSIPDIPVTVDPGCIVVMLTLSAHAS